MVARHLNVEAVKAVAAGRWVEIISQLGNVAPAILDGKHHPCPKCGGKNRFRLINEDAGACLCNQCFNTKNGDGIAAVQWLSDSPFNVALRLIAQYLDVDPLKNRNGQSDDADIVERIARLKRVPLESFKAFGAHRAKRGRLTVCRLPMFDEHGKECSYFDISDKDAKWLKGYSAKKKPVGVFLAGGKRPEEGETVLIVEGVKDATALHGLGDQSAGLPTKEMNVKFARLFAGCNCIIIPDRDTAGEKGAQVTAARLAGVSASVRIATLPGELKESGGDDVRDVLAREGGELLLRQAIEDAKEWKPQSEDDDSATADYSDIPCSRTDISNAARFVEMHGAECRYCFVWKKWLVWDGQRWAIDNGGHLVRKAKRVAKHIFGEALESLDDGEFTWAKYTAKAKGIDAMLKLAAPELPVLPADLDCNPWLLNCPNGTLDLRTGELRGHRQEDCITKLCPTEFNPEAPSFTWDRFLEDVFEETPVIDFVQRLLGYAATGDVREQVLPVFYGSGANGKSTMLEAVKETLGPDYCIVAAKDLLLAKKGDAHPTEIADLHGKRLVIAMETENNRTLAESLVKQLTGGDTIKARRMREDFWEFAPTHKLILCTNHRPRVKGNDYAIWRRLRLVPFTVRFEGDRKDKSMPAKLRAEREGILAWIVRGCLDWQAQGLNEPETVKVATDQYRTSEDVIAQFVVDQCVALGEVRAKAFREALHKWCEHEGHRTPSQTAIGEWIDQNGYGKRTSNGTIYTGLGLKADP